MRKPKNMLTQLLGKNVENHATFVEEFWPKFYARGRFLKYFMSASFQAN